MTLDTLDQQKWTHCLVIQVKQRKTGWVPEITVREMCAEMVASDLSHAKQHALLKKHGYETTVSIEG